MRKIHFLIFSVLASVIAVDVNSRVDCFPEPGASEDACNARGCIWQEAAQGSPVNTPWCFYSPQSGYRVSQENVNYYQLVPENNKNPYGENISPLDVKIRKNGATLQVSIGNSGRFTPPVQFPESPGKSSESLNFVSTVIDNSNVFAFQIVRESTNTPLWDTSIGGMQFADQFIQIATYLPSTNVFGFGQHVHHRLKHDLSRYTVWPMFARDIGPDSSSSLSTQNLYGVHPFYICVENDGKAHGVFILNSNAQEVETGPGPHLVYRTIGGQLDIAFFPGPTPEEVVQQYLNHIGLPFLPAYWALGYQLSRWGYKNLEDMKAVVGRVQAAQIPLDIVYADIDYMERYKDFTLGPDWAGFGAYVDELHGQGLHLILIFDPAIEADYGSFERALNQNASFIEWAKQSQVPKNIQSQYPLAAKTLIMLGNVWPDRNTAMPDFLDPNNKTQQWWTSECQLFHKTVAFDGMWIDMNEPSNFDTDTYSEGERSVDDVTAHLSCPITGPDSALDNPPYKTYAVYNRQGEQLCSKTLCMLAKTGRRTMDFYNTKNLYGMSEAKATSQALSATTSRRGAVISRSTFPSSGHYGGTWLGDNTATWNDLQTSIVGVMEFNWFGLPYVGSDICGFNGNTTEELCLRWHQMGAFHSFCRDHNTHDGIPQDPAVWPSVANAARIALSFRYRYLPYLYSLHYSAALYGNTVIRPLFFEFPQDSTVMEVDHQFMWGSALMIAPAVEQGITTVHAYFPDGVWYSLVPETYAQRMDVGYVDVDARLDSLTPVYVRGGYILPRQQGNTTTTQSRRNPLELLVSIADNSPSQGELYWDAGDDLYESLDKHQRHHWKFTFNVTANAASLAGECESCSPSVTIPSLNLIDVFGYGYYPDFTSFQLDGKKVNINVLTSSFSPITRRLVISTDNLVTLSNYVNSSNNRFLLSWNHQAISVVF
ncbi:hypothetical protein RB195_000206 [Necator americanus]|uniref:P-type domain-containing protein n=1 Tax=Necator americanus TaxID=51031 RepID=A0ABR1D8I1_NECAM